MVKFNIAQVNEVMWTYLADKATVHESLTEQKKTLTSSDQFSEILQPMSSWKVKKTLLAEKQWIQTCAWIEDKVDFFVFSFFCYNFQFLKRVKNEFYRPSKQAWKTFT